MNFKSKIALVLLALLLISCKDKREKLGDEYLNKGHYQQAIRMYSQSIEKGGGSDEIYNNLTIAVLRYMVSLSENPENEMILKYKDALAKEYLSKTNDPLVYDELQKQSIIIAQKLIMHGVDINSFPLVLEGKDLLNKVSEMLISKEISTTSLDAEIQKLETNYANSVVNKANDESDPVAAEYWLLEAENVFPKNESIVAELNKIRVTNRGNFLIWSMDLNGIKPSRKVDKYPYAVAFPKINIGKSSINSTVEIYNFSGMHTKISPTDIALFSKDGQKVPAKLVRGGCKKLPSDESCVMALNFKFNKSFIPDYVYVDNKEGIGKKYLGMK